MFAVFAAEGPNGRFLPSDIKEFWWSTAAFLVVLSLILWKLLPVIKKAMSDRSDRIRQEIVDAERAKVEAESELSSLRSKLGDADAEDGHEARAVADREPHEALACITFHT